MKLQWHVATAIPFLLLGAPLAALACIAPDIPWIVAEFRYQKWRRGASGLYATSLGEASWYDWLKARDGFARLPKRVLVAYRLTHSPYVWLMSFTASIGFNLSHTSPVQFEWWGVPWLVYAGWAIHIALDAFTHDGPLRMQYMYPIVNAEVPDDAVADAFAIDRDTGWFDAVLLSAGWESTLCLIRAVERSRRTGARVVAVFVDYDQPQAREEETRARHLALIAGVALRVVHAPEIRGIGKSSDGRTIYAWRNATFVHRVEKLYATEFLRTIWVGYRGVLPMFDEFTDANAVWAWRMGRIYDVQIKSPCVLWPKWAVKRAVRRAKVSDQWICSSEGVK